MISFVIVMDEPDLGDGGVGKTVLYYAYTKKQFGDEYVPNVMEFQPMPTMQLDGRRVNLEIYDTAGQEDFVQIRTLVYPGTDGTKLLTSQVFPETIIFFSVSYVL